MTALASLAEENRNLTVNEAALVWSAIKKERERISVVIRELDDFAYREVPYAGSVVDERPSMERLAILIGCGE